MINPNSLWTLIKASFASWKADRANSMGAALSYYTAFSLAPILLIVISVAGIVFGRDAAYGGIVQELQGLIGKDGATMVEAMLKSTSSESSSIIATIVGFLTLLIGATTVVVELQTDLDLIWKAPPRGGNGLWGFIRDRMLSFAMILAVGFLLMVSLVASTAISWFGDYMVGLFPGWEALLQAVNFIVSFAIITVLFALIYKFLPNTKIRWNDVWIGAAVTSFLFAIGKFLIGMYLGRSGLQSSYGAAAGFVILLLWVYYSAQIFLLGAEFTKTYAHSHGSLRTATQQTKDATAPISSPAPARPSFAKSANAQRHAGVLARWKDKPLVPLFASAVAGLLVGAALKLTRRRYLR